MKKGAGKRKGGQFERTICVALSKWLSQGDREDLLWRSAMSGGRATLWRDKKGTLLSNQSGDLSSINPKSHEFIDNFYCEAKAYKDLNYPGFLLTNSGHLYKFWHSTIEEAKIYEKQPMLIAKQNHLPIIVLLQEKGAKMLSLFQQNCVLIAPQQGNAMGFLFDDFIRLAKPL